MPKGTDILKILPGIKETELAKLGPCRICGEPLTSEILFYRVTIERAGFEARAMQRRIGLSMMIGGPLATIMGPDEDLAKVIDGPQTAAVHESCAGDVRHLMQLFQGEEYRDE